MTDFRAGGEQTFLLWCKLAAFPQIPGIAKDQIKIAGRVRLRDVAEFVGEMNKRAKSWSDLAVLGLTQNKTDVRPVARIAVDLAHLGSGGGEACQPG